MTSSFSDIKRTSTSQLLAVLPAIRKNSAVFAAREFYIPFHLTAHDVRLYRELHGVLSRLQSEFSFFFPDFSRRPTSPFGERIMALCSAGPDSFRWRAKKKAWDKW